MPSAKRIEHPTSAIFVGVRGWNSGLQITQCLDQPANFILGVIMNDADSNDSLVGIFKPRGVVPCLAIELFDRLCEVSGRTVPVEENPPRPGDLLKNSVYPEKARQLLGWEPRVDLGQGLKETFDYFFQLNEENLHSDKVTQDVLILTGKKDHFIPLKMHDMQVKALANARSVTARVFTRDDQAHNHCQIGNMGLALDVMARWLEERC